MKLFSSPLVTHAAIGAKANLGNGKETADVKSPGVDGGPPPPEDMPLPRDARGFFLGGLFVLASLAAAYTAREIVIPVVLAYMLKLVFQPVVRWMGRFRIPGLVASVAIIAGLVTLLYLAATMIAGPSAAWAKKAPTVLPRIEQRLKGMNKPLATAEDVLRRAERAVRGDVRPAPPAAAAPTLIDRFFSETGTGAARLFITIILLFYFLLSGDTFLRRFIEVLPDFRSKRQAVDIVQQIESDLSRYLFTITIMNTLVGIAVGAIMYAFGMGDAFFWGAIAFLLNYIPIFGPTLGVIMFAAVGLMTIDNLPDALFPALSYLGVHFLEGEFVTPMLLARRFTLNPVLVAISILFWTWMWGLVGALLAVPLLACFKIIADRTRPLTAVGHFMAR